MNDSPGPRLLTGTSNIDLLPGPNEPDPMDAFRRPDGRMPLFINIKTCVCGEAQEAGIHSWARCRRLFAKPGEVIRPAWDDAK